MIKSDSWKLLIVVIVVCLLVIVWHFDARAGHYDRPYLAEYDHGYVVVKVSCAAGYSFSTARVWIQRPDETSFPLDLHWWGEGEDGLCYWDGYHLLTQSGVWTVLFGSTRPMVNEFDGGIDGTPRAWAPYQVLFPLLRK